jgi:hypothetical protein
MSLVPLQSISVGSLEEAASGALGNLLEALSVSDSSVLDEGRKTTTKCASVGTELMLKIAAIIEENRTLRTQLVLARHHEQENKMIDQAIVTAAHEEAKIARDDALAVRHEVQAVRKEMEALITEKAAEALASKQAHDAELSEAHQQLRASQLETETIRHQAVQEAAAARAVQAAAVLAVTQTKAAELAAALQEAEDARHKAIQDQKVAVETELQRQDTLRLESVISRWSGRCPLPPFVQILAILIQQRKARTIHLDTNSEEQKKDTAVMQSIYPQINNYLIQQTRPDIPRALANLIADRNQRL